MQKGGVLEVVKVLGWEGDAVVEEVELEETWSSRREAVGWWSCEKGLELLIVA